MSTSIHHHSHRPSRIEQVLRPRNMLDLVFGTVAACLVVSILTFSALAKPYQQPQDLRQQAATDQLSPIDRCDRFDIAMSDECRVLNDFYNATRGDSWVYPANVIHWFANPIVCSWDGIKCENGRVIAIQLPGHKVSGTLPNNLSELLSLRYVVLYNNDISGPIPSNLGKIRLLEQLDLSQNAFAGPLPAALGDLSQLTLLNVAQTQLTGALPLSLTKLYNLQEFTFNATQLCIPTDKTFITFLQNIPNMVGTDRYCPSLTTAPVTPTSAPLPTATLQPTTPVSSPTPTPTPVKNCNQICTTNAQCGVNMRCYQVGSEYKCRLAANPNNDSCQSPADNGLQRSCNEYCSDTSECQSGLLCWYNRCRRPDNSESTSCAVPSQAVIAAMRASCNTSCASNRDCAINLRCYQSKCRLATNPPSASCRPAPLTTTANSQTKGGLGGTTVTPPEVSPTVADATGNATDSSDSTDASSAPTLTSPTGVEPTSPPPPKSSGLFLGIVNFFKGLSTPEQSNTRRMLIAIMAVGLILIGVAFVINAMTNKSKRKTPQGPPPTGGTMGTTATTTVAKSKPEVTPPASDAVTTKVDDAVPPSTLTTAPMYPSGGMTARLKQKGVTPPS